MQLYVLCETIMYKKPSGLNFSVWKHRKWVLKLHSEDAGYTCVEKVDKSGCHKRVTWMAGVLDL